MNTRADLSSPHADGAKPLVLRTQMERRATAPLGQILLDMGELSAGDMIKAAAIRARKDVRYGEILIANHMVSEAGLFRGLAAQYGCEVADLRAPAPDIRLIDSLGVEKCLHHAIVPWKRVGAATVVATAQPENFAALKSRLPPDFGPVLMVVAPEGEIQKALLRIRQRTLAKRAETRVAANESCRDWRPTAMARLTAAVLIAILGGVVLAPNATLLVFSVWAIVALVFNTSLKAAASIATLRAARPAKTAFSTRRRCGPKLRLPIVSIMVPLFREREIAGRLVRRLNRLNYPRELLDICLAVEEDGLVTQATLRVANLPNWMRQIVVPRAALKTKPRALNYALDFCRGSIIGVYDAEDAPEPDQLFKVARRFHDSAPDVACLQGVLDFYNARANWLSRCFTIEYATWFRVVLPGLEKLGFIIPLGGTTLFFRRDALEKIGAWDAHNVTEDADLGIRLARYGYRTELIPTLTEEEANCRFWPWVRQRSRWLKGYAMTWAVHMRSPRKLWSDVGPWRFFGIQLLFLGALSQFLLAPLLWSFWALPLGLPHPLTQSISADAFLLLTVLFLASEAVSLGVSVFALAPNRHKWLWLWVPTMHLYFPLGAIAAYKAIWEMISKPFYWDKTTHGLSDVLDSQRASARSISRRRPNRARFQRRS